MKCLKCGAYVYSSDKFCRNCGTTLNSDTCQYGDNISNSKFDSSSCHEKQYNYNYEYSNKTEPKYNMNASHADQYEYNSKYAFDYSKFDYINKPNDSGGDDKYLKAYIGPNYDNIKKMKFSFPALIFGPWYLLYRKAWGYAIGMIIISIAATILLSSNVANLINIIINIILAFKFKSIYFKQAEDHVESIKQQNLDKSTLELLEVCKKKGGTSFIGPIIIIITSLILIILAAGLFYDPLETPSSTEEPEVVEEVESTNSRLTYKIPTEFRLIYENGNYKRYSYTLNTSTTCNFTIDKTTALHLYSDEKNYLEKHVRSTDSDYQLSSITPITLNGQEWKYQHLESSRKSETQYALKTTEEIYVIKTYDYKINNTTNTECNTKYNEFLTTLKVETSF